MKGHALIIHEKLMPVCHTQAFSIHQNRIESIRRLYLQPALCFQMNPKTGKYHLRREEYEIFERNQKYLKDLITTEGIFIN